MLHAIGLGGAADTGRARASVGLDTAPVTLPVAADLEADRMRRDARLVRERPVGAAEIRRCLEAQSRAEPRGPWAAVFGADPLAPAARDDFAAAVESGRVARALDGLEGWRVLHSLPNGPGDQDVAHLLIGAAGAVVLVVRGSTGRHAWAAGEDFVTAGRSDDALRKAMEAREDVAARLGVAVGAEVPVHAAVVLPSGDRAVIGARTGAAVLTLDRLEGWIRHLPTVLEADQVAALVDASERADTWRDRPSSELSDPAEERAFAALVRSVTVARRRRTAWELGGAGLGVALCALALLGGVPTALADALSLALR